MLLREVVRETLVQKNAKLQAANKRCIEEDNQLHWAVFKWRVSSDLMVVKGWLRKQLAECFELSLKTARFGHFQLLNQDANSIKTFSHFYFVVN